MKYLLLFTLIISINICNSQNVSAFNPFSFLLGSNVGYEDLLNEGLVSEVEEISNNICSEHPYMMTAATLLVLGTSAIIYYYLKNDHNGDQNTPTTQKGHVRHHSVKFDNGVVLTDGRHGAEK